jgi:hypothetical protein
MALQLTGRRLYTQVARGQRGLALVLMVTVIYNERCACCQQCMIGYCTSPCCCDTIAAQRQLLLKQVSREVCVA